MADLWGNTTGLSSFSSRSTSVIRQSRNAAAEVESVMGRRPSVPPPHLSRILYVPRHTSLTTHLPLYDVSAQYRKAEVGSALIESSLFTIRLGLMTPPREDGTDGDVQYLVDFLSTVIGTGTGTGTGSGDGEVVRAKVQQRVLGIAGSEVDLLLPHHSMSQPQPQPQSQQEAPSPPASEEAEFTVKIFASNNPFRNRVSVRMSFPVPDYVTKAGVSRNPYFDFVLPGSNERLQWQIHPVEHGPLRYTLVSVEPGTAGKETESESIHAIYHHIGLGTSLSTMQHSEGVLLLPPWREAGDSAREGVIVATLLGLLWRLREMGDQAGGNGRRTSEGGRRNSLFGKMLRKRSTG